VFNGDRAHAGFILNVWDKLWLASLTLFAVAATVFNILAS